MWPAGARASSVGARRPGLSAQLDWPQAGVGNSGFDTDNGSLVLDVADTGAGSYAVDKLVLTDSSSCLLGLGCFCWRARRLGRRMARPAASAVS